ncbi:hypothetical protein CAPTEDRAFT_127520, partial [Capitella teleta]
THCTAALRDLHWFPVRQRIDNNILLITHQAIHCHNVPITLVRFALSTFRLELSVDHNMDYWQCLQ